MNTTYRDLTNRLRNSVNCLNFAVSLLGKLEADADRAATLEVIERQAREAEATARELGAAAGDE